MFEVLPVTETVKIVDACFYELLSFLEIEQ